MGIRSNIGNITTNAMQTLAVSGTTASRFFRDRADSALNNLSKEEQAQYYQMRADKMRKEMSDFYSQEEKAKTDPKTYTKYTEEQAKKVGKATVKSRVDRAERILNEEDNVDDLLKDEIKIAPDTEEGINVNRSSNRRVNYVEGRTNVKPIEIAKPSEEKTQELIDKGEI